MSLHSEIDETLRRLGSAEPPSGLARRVNLRLQSLRDSSSSSERFSLSHRFFLSKTRTVAACALAASIAFSAAALNPAVRSLMFHRHSSTQGAPAINAPRIAAPPSGGFGTAGAVHVPVEPVPVQPTPVNQGRGRSRSGRAVLPTGAPAQLPRGVAAPH